MNTPTDTQLPRGARQKVQDSIIVRALRRFRCSALYRKRQLGHWLLHSRLHPLYLAVRPRWSGPDPYTSWIEQREAAFPSLEHLEAEAAAWSHKPVISVVMPACNPKRDWFEAAIDSVVRQSYPHWQLCVCDDASDAPWIAESLCARTACDPRIRFVRSEHRLGISGALNAAGGLASGDYVAFLDHDDLLHPYALHYIARTFQDPDTKIVYSDEDHLDEAGRRVRPQFKPDWSPDLLLSCMYFGHLFAAERDCVEKAGWFRSCCDGSQDYDLALRLTNMPVRIEHIRFILYHWREHGSSTAASASAKPYTQAAGKKALEHALHARHVRASVDNGPYANTYSIRRTITGTPLVSIVIRSCKPKLLARCLRSLQLNTSYSSREFVIVRHQPASDVAFDKVLAGSRATALSYSGPFHIARMNNLGMDAARGDMCIFLNDNVQAIRADWLERLVMHLQRSEVGVAGPKLVYPSGAIQHAGIAVGIEGVAVHPGRGVFQSALWPWLDLTRNVSAVTGACLGVRRPTLVQLGGFDDAFASHSDIDLCLRAREAGYRIVYEPAAVLCHDDRHTLFEDTSAEDDDRFRQRWAAILCGTDPYYSDALDHTTGEIRLTREKITPSQ